VTYIDRASTVAHPYLFLLCALIHKSPVVVTHSHMVLVGSIVKFPFSISFLVSPFLALHLSRTCRLPGDLLPHSDPAASGRRPDRPSGLIHVLVCGIVTPILDFDSTRIYIHHLSCDVCVLGHGIFGSTILINFIVMSVSSVNIVPFLLQYLRDDMSKHSFICWFCIRIAAMYGRVRHLLHPFTFVARSCVCS
jgi:hypothetical protein